MSGLYSVAAVTYAVHWYCCAAVAFYDGRRHKKLLRLDNGRVYGLLFGCADSARDKRNLGGLGQPDLGAFLVSATADEAFNRQVTAQTEAQPLNRR